MNVVIPLKIDESKLNGSIVYGTNNYWANRFHVGESLFLVSAHFVHSTDLQLRVGAPAYNLNDHLGEYFLLTYRNANGTYSTLPISIYQMFKNSSDADTMKISNNNVSYLNYHPARMDNNQMHALAKTTDHTSDPEMWTGSVYYIDLPAMQKAMSKYGYSFNLKADNSGVMDFYSYNNFGGKAAVNSNLQIFHQGQQAGIKISPAMYLEIHRLLAGQEVTVEYGGRVTKIGNRTSGTGIGQKWNFLDNVALVKQLNGAREVAAKESDLSYTGRVDVNTEGDYPITLNLKLADGETVSVDSVVHVVPKFDVISSETKNVTRTIVFHNPDGTTTRQSQNAAFSHTVSRIDSTVYDNWTPSGNQTLTAYEIPTISGYHATIDGQTVTEVPFLTVNHNSNNVTVDVYYTADANKPSDTTETTETRAVTRTINLHEPDGGVVPTIQTVHFNRTNTTTNGQTTYGNWTTDGNDGFAAYTIPVLNGYHATLNGQTVTEVAAENNVTADTASSTVDVYYVADAVEPNKPSDNGGKTQPNQPSDNGGKTTPTTPNKPSDQGKQTQLQQDNVPSATSAQTAMTKTTVAPVQGTAQSNSQTQKLPQTGNDQAAVLGLAGLAMTGLAMMLGTSKWRHN